jgi:hypothetical protein
VSWRCESPAATPLTGGRIINLSGAFAQAIAWLEADVATGVLLQP